MKPEEAELAKLFTNVWRHIKFATANWLRMMANDRGLTSSGSAGLIMDYPRAAGMPGARIAAGSCLFRAKRIMGTDPCVTADPGLLPLDEVLAEADLLIIAAPHLESPDLMTKTPTADICHILRKGVQV